MKKFIFTSLLIIVISSHAFSQWVQMSNGMGTSTHVLSLAVNGNTLFAGTYQYGVYISTNYGTNWAQTVLNNINVRSLAVLGNTLFAGADYEFYSGSGGVYRSTNNGTSWTQTTLNNQDVLTFAKLGNNIFAGTRYAGVYISTNNGMNWSQTALNRTTYSLVVLGNTIFAGTYNFNGSGGGVYLTTNNGLSWTQSSLNNQNVDILITLGNTIFAGLDISTGSGGVYISTNNGINWDLTGLNNIPVVSLAVSGNNIFAGTAYSGIWLSTNNGTNWLNKNQGFSSPPTIGAIIIANNNVFSGNWGISCLGVWRRSYNEIIGIKQISEIVPESYSLSQNYPNPFNPTTVIRFQLSVAGNASLKIFDMLGHEIEVLVNERLNAGTYTVDWDGTRFASGVYFYRLTAEGYGETRKMILVR